MACHEPAYSLTFDKDGLFVTHYPLTITIYAEKESYLFFIHISLNLVLPGSIPKKFQAREYNQTAKDSHAL